MSQLFKDVVEGRDKAYPMRFSSEEMKALHDEAKRRGVHVSTIIRRCLRIGLVERPETMPK